MANISPLKLPFDEAIAFFHQKLNIPSESWQDIWQESHDFAFSVAGVFKAELLEGLRQSVEKALVEGTSIEEFRQDFNQIAERNGWSPKGGKDWRAKIIFQTNLQVAYAAGRYRQMTAPEVLSARPYWEWRHGAASIEPRPLHQQWDGLILRADDPWWASHYPPCGFGCKCRVFALSNRDLDRMGRSPDQAPDDGFYNWIDNKGREQRLPNGVDPGWGYAPGASLPQQRREILARTIDRLPADLGREVRNGINFD